jgi:hypothetical protein
MGDKPVITMLAGPSRYRGIAILTAISVGLGCSMLAAPASAQSLGDRFKSLFGGKPDEPAAATPQTPPPDGQVDMNCPPVAIRAGASTYAVAEPGKQPVGNDLRYQATITKTARDCTRTGSDITARVGIQGRVIAGPAGNPATVEIPMRVAVVQGGVSEKTIATKVYRTTVTMDETGSVPFSLVAEDLVYPAPVGAIGDSYIFYIGFDPQALTPEPRAKAAPKKKKPAAPPPPPS